jgi:transketolase
MRNVFAAEMTAIAQTDPRLMLLSGDIGNRLFDKFKDVAPSRFLNCGIAEANMMGMAAGMALSGLRPFVYTITPFTTIRCLEQIRIDVCYHKAPVVIVGTGSGLSYADLGPTHHSCEDIALMRVLPDMVVLCPADNAELKGAIHAALAQDNPVYIRLGKKGEPDIHDTAPDFAIGRAITVRDGAEVCLLGTGNSVAIALEAARILDERGIHARVESMHTVKPLDEARLAEIFARYGTVAVIEEHSRIGGFGGAVAEWMARRDGGPTPRFVAFGIPDAFPHYVGSQSYLRERFGLSPQAVADAVGAAQQAVAAQ